MWIHVPPTSSQSVADTGGSSSELKQPWLEELLRSATWKTKSVSLQSLRRVCKTVPSIQRLSGLTSEPSIQNRGVEKWISSLEGFHASHTAWRETSSEKMTQENSAEKSLESQPDLDTQLSFFKMFQESCDSTTKTSDQDFKAWATPLRKDSLRRRKQAHLTEDKGSSSWPTPNASDQYNPNLKDNHDVEKQYLRGVAANWPTPASRDWKGFDPPGKQNTKSDPKMYHSIPQAPTTTKDGHTCSTSCRRLNPLFAEMLMGLPPGWTNGYYRSAMELYLWWQVQLGYYLLNVLDREK